MADKLIEMMKQLNIVIVGCGKMSEAWIKAALPLAGVRVVGFVDVVQAAATARRDQFGLSDAIVGTNLSEVLKQSQANVVFNITVPEAHFEVTMTALEHGCHVLSEKPLANSMSEAKAINQSAKDKGLIFAVMQNRQHIATMRRIRQLVRSGVLGEITTVNIDFYIGAHFGGFRDHMPHVLLLDMAIHTFDQARFLIDADPAEVLFAKEWNPTGSWYAQDASAIAIYQMNTGAVVNYRGSWCSEGLRTAWESEWRIVGSQGTLKWDGADQIETEVLTQTGGFISDFKTLDLPTLDEPSKTEGHTSLVSDFVHCVQHNKTPETHGEDNVKSLAMVFGAIESAARRIAVRISGLN